MIKWIPNKQVPQQDKKASNESRKEMTVLLYCVERTAGT
jgi:hypothetical protein